jgi:DNA-binding response OmpR family regulator
MKICTTPQILIAADAQGRLGKFLTEACEAAGFSSAVISQQEMLLQELHTLSYSIVILTNNVLSPQEIVELIPSIRSINQDVKIIVMSGWNQDNFSERVLVLGASHFFPMPVKLDILTKCICNVMVASPREKNG